MNYAVTAYVRNIEAAVSGSSTVPKVQERLAMVVSFRKGAR